MTVASKVTPRRWNKALRESAVVLDGNQVVGARLPAIAGPANGTTVDAEARSALAQILAALRAHGLIQT